MIKQNQTIELNGRGNLLPPADSMPRGGAMAHLAEFVRNGDNDPLQKVERSIHFMVANINRPLQVSTLAAQANVSPSHFFALFKQMTGRPPMDYFTKLRMSHACRLLDSTRASVKEVAAALGYNDPFYFSRVFKSVLAVAPVYYRGLGFASRREIKELLEPKDQATNGDPLRQAGLGRLPAKSSSSQVYVTQQNQQKPNPRT
jgi:AraC-like DNA-binding protein